MNPSDVTFNPVNMYWKNPGKRKGIINLVVRRAPAEATSATVVNGWHTSHSDGRLHCTVDYFNAAGGLIERQHIV